MVKVLELLSLIKMTDGKKNVIFHVLLDRDCKGVEDAEVEQIIVDKDDGGMMICAKPGS